MNKPFIAYTMFFKKRDDGTMKPELVVDENSGDYIFAADELIEMATEKTLNLLTKIRQNTL